MAEPLKTHPLPSVDTQVLYRQYQPLNGEEVADIITAAARSVGIAPSSCKMLNTSTDRDIRILCGNYHVLVTQSVPFENSGHLDVALESFSVRRTFANAAEVVAAATAVTQISVMKGVIPTEAVPDQMLRTVGMEQFAFCETGETGNAMAIARIVTEMVVGRTNPDAVFWGPSVFLMQPKTFTDFSGAEDPIYLYLHPHLYSEADPLTGEQLVGVIGSGAPWLIGHSLEFKPCGLPPEYLVQVMYAFVRFTQLSGKLLPEGDVFGRDENEKVRMLIHRNSDDRPDSIELKVVHNPALGINAEPVPTLYKHYDDDCRFVDAHMDGGEETDLDPDDAVDAAILERLRALDKAPETSGAPLTGGAQATEASTPPVQAPDEEALADIDFDVAAATPGPMPDPVPQPVQEPAYLDPATGEQDPEAIAGPEQTVSGTEPSGTESSGTGAPDMDPSGDQLAPATAAEAPDAISYPRKRQSQAARRPSMKELRTFALQAQVQPDERKPAVKKSGLIGKLFSKKSG